MSVRLVFCELLDCLCRLDFYFWHTGLSFTAFVISKHSFHTCAVKNANTATGRSFIWSKRHKAFYLKVTKSSAAGSAVGGGDSTGLWSRFNLWTKNEGRKKGFMSLICSPTHHIFLCYLLFKCLAKIRPQFIQLKNKMDVFFSGFQA